MDLGCDTGEKKTVKWRNESTYKKTCEEKTILRQSNEKSYPSTYYLVFLPHCCTNAKKDNDKLKETDWKLLIRKNINA